MTDPTIDAIDHALEDWATSDDAMRWTPDQPADHESVPIREWLVRACCDLLLYGETFIVYDDEVAHLPDDVLTGVREARRRIDRHTPTVYEWQADP